MVKRLTNNFLLVGHFKDWKVYHEHLYDLVMNAIDITTRTHGNMDQKTLIQPRADKLLGVEASW